jgi:hypothetical protein
MPKSEQKLIEARRREWLKQGRDRAKQKIRQARESDGFIVGFRILIGNQCKAVRQYNRAFLPIQIARKHPTLFPPYEGVCQYGTCDCDFEDVFESDVLAQNTPVIAKPGKVITLRKLHRKSHPILWLLCLGAIAYVVWKMMKDF